MKINCPICRSATTWEENPNRPFCSERCKTQDLGNWASESYTFDGDEQANSDEIKEEQNE